MSTLEVNTINPQSGTTITIGGSGDTVTLGSGATQSGFGGENTPAFWVTLSGSDQTLPHDTSTKIQFNTTTLDTNSSWDSSNYRFTPSVAGYYFIYAKWRLGTSNNSSQMKCLIKKNGSDLALSSSTNDTENTAQASSIVQMNGTTDYVEVYAYHVTSLTQSIKAQTQYTVFQGFKLIGV